MNHPSPYAPPRSAIAPTKPNDFGPVKIFSTQGRLGRVRYIGYSTGMGLLANLAMLLIGGAANLVQGDHDSQLAGLLTGGVVISIGLVALVISFLLTIQRLHDFNASGKWSVLILLPLVNLVFYLILLIMPGTQGPNRFGNPPPPNTLGVILLALILPLIMVIGIIAAIAIPTYMDYTERAQEETPRTAPLPQ